MVGDGNCQLRAIALGHYRDETKHAKVRKKAVDYIRDNRAVFDRTGGMIEIEDNNGKRIRISFSKYLEEMEKDNCWGDDMTLVAAVRSLGRDIVVVTMNLEGVVTHAQRYNANGGNDRASTDAVGYNENTLVLGYLQNRHYVLLRNPSSGATGG